MHLAEGILPAAHAAAWTAASAPFVGFGLVRIKRMVAERPERRMLIGAAAAFSFVLSALKLPSVAGSSSHPTGTGLGGVMFGPLVMAPVGLVVLLFQALLEAHGGVTTLGANLFSMGVAGPLAAWAVWRASSAFRVPKTAGVFLAAALADLATYLVTAAQLALAFPEATGGVPAAFGKFAAAFAFTQVPAALTEGLLTAVVLGALARFDPKVLADLGLADLARTRRAPLSRTSLAEEGAEP